MSLLFQILVLLHVITAAAWFGLALRLPAQARLAASGEQAVANDGARAVQLMGIFLLLTFVFAMAVLFLGGGYAGQIQYHIASGLIVLMLVLQFVFIGPAWSRMQSAVSAGEDATGMVSSVAMFTGIGHLFWLVLIVLMFWNRFVSAV